MCALHNPSTRAAQDQPTKRPRVAPRHKYPPLAAMLCILTASLAMPVGWTAPLEIYGRLPSLSRSETRLQMLQSSVAFLRTHNPPD